MKIIDKCLGTESQHVNLGACIKWDGNYYICTNVGLKPNHVTFINLESGRCMTLNNITKVRVIKIEAFMGDLK